MSGTVLPTAAATLRRLTRRILAKYRSCPWCLGFLVHLEVELDPCTLSVLGGLVLPIVSHLVCPPSRAPMRASLASMIEEFEQHQRKFGHKFYVRPPAATYKLQ